MATSPWPPQARVHQLRRAQAGRQRQPARQRLAAHQQVGAHALGPAHPHAAGAAEPGEDLVHHQQRAGTVAGRAQLGQEPGRRLHHAAAALHRLDHHAGHPVAQLGHAAVGGQLRGRQPGRERLAELRPAARRQRGQTGAVVAALEAGHQVAAGGQPRRLQRQLDRAGAGQVKQRPGQARAAPPRPAARPAAPAPRSGAGRRARAAAGRPGGGWRPPPAGFGGRRRPRRIRTRDRCRRGRPRPTRSRPPPAATRSARERVAQRALVQPQPLPQRVAARPHRCSRCSPPARQAADGVAGDVAGDARVLLQPPHASSAYQASP